MSADQRRQVRISSRNATFQQWQSLLGNRTKRNRHREFLVQGVRPLTLALEHQWPVRALLRGDAPLSDWAEGVWEQTAAGLHGILTPELMAELGGKQEATPELLAVLELPPDDLDRLQTPGRVPLLTVFDRPGSPGNIGTLTRSVDAFGGSGVVVTGHAADPYDPRCVRASTGSMLTVPVVRVPSHVELLAWIAQPAQAVVSADDAAGSPGGLSAREQWQVVGLDEAGDVPVREVDLTLPTVLVIGNETRGLTRAWREACDHLVSIPMVGSASSLNAAVAGSLVLHEALQQRLRT